VRRPPKAAGAHCTICGTFSRNGKRIDGVGWVGPTCYRKIAALKAVLERDGLTTMFEGRVEYDVERGRDSAGVVQLYAPANVSALHRRAEQLGFKVKWEWLEKNVRAACWISIPESGKMCRRLFHRLEKAVA